MTSTERLRNIRAILKAIEKGYCKGNTIEYIMDLYDTTTQAATDIISLDCNTIEQLLDNEYTSDDQLVEELERLKLTKHVIAYVIDSDDKCVPDKQYQIDIDHGHVTIESCCNIQWKNTFPSVSRYLIYDNKVARKLISGTSFITNSTNENYYLNPCNLTQNDNITRTDRIFEAKREIVSLNYPLQWNTKYEHGSNSNNFRDIFDGKHKSIVWSLDNYTLNSNYLTFYSRIHTIVETTDPNACKNHSLSESYTPGDKLKIPLIDNLIMETPLGTVSVREVKVVTD